MMSGGPERQDLIVPLHAEDVVIGRRVVAGDVVRVETITGERTQDIDEQLAGERVEVDRVAINRAVDAVPAIRQDGDLTIIPVVEERVVVTRQLILTEEIHIRRIKTARRYQETVVLREQRAVVTRSAAADGSTAQPVQET